MKKLYYDGNWQACFMPWNGELAVVEDGTGGYSRHSHFVQEVKRHAPGGCMVFSRKKVCYIARGDV